MPKFDMALVPTTNVRSGKAEPVVTTVKLETPVEFLWPKLDNQKPTSQNEPAAKKLKLEKPDEFSTNSHNCTNDKHLQKIYKSESDEGDASKSESSNEEDESDEGDASKSESSNEEDENDEDDASKSESSNEEDESDENHKNAQQRKVLAVLMQQLQKSHLKNRCTKCGKQCTSLHSLRGHIRYNHTKKQCQRCNQQFESQRWLQKHIEQAHHSWHCKRCNKDFFDYNAYRSHFATIHVKKPKCSFCDFVPTRSRGIHSHIKRSHNPNSMFTCNTCSCRFETQYGLTAHITRSHRSWQH